MLCRRIGVCICSISFIYGSGRVVRWCWVNFQCRGFPLIWIRVGQGPTVLAVGTGAGCLDIFTLLYAFFPLSPSLWETARYKLKHCLKGLLNPNQPKKSFIYSHNLSKQRFDVTAYKNILAVLIYMTTFGKSNQYLHYS